MFNQLMCSVCALGSVTSGAELVDRVARVQHVKSTQYLGRHLYRLSAHLQARSTPQGLGLLHARYGTNGHNTSQHNRHDNMDVQAGGGGACKKVWTPPQESQIGL
jgi:hypothetical protein